MNWIFLSIDIVYLLELDGSRAVVRSVGSTSRKGKDKNRMGIIINRP